MKDLNECHVWDMSHMGMLAHLKNLRKIILHELEKVYPFL